ncbi:hypothetical protein A5637_07430 [Mycolicibacterium fortuitum]|nr:hypothetical protein A5637_07430 [Mycolicibacterium fortuitum]OBK62761.1 hypothetical protein A5654_25335 [Mycolicibacterium fortuitum]
MRGNVGLRLPFNRIPTTEHIDRKQARMSNDEIPDRHRTIALIGWFISGLAGCTALLGDMTSLLPGAAIATAFAIAALAALVSMIAHPRKL